jgi:hypothetical protein
MSAVSVCGRLSLPHPNSASGAKEGGRQWRE